MSPHGNLPSPPFRFKQFEVQQDRCAMKVGTDGVLLGAWVRIGPAPGQVVDAGSGTGLIALQLAQRFPHLRIWAIEKDPAAARQCRDNLACSPWSERLFCIQSDFGVWEPPAGPIDAVVSNPPFYLNPMSSRSASRDLARQSDFLTPATLFDRAGDILCPEGRVSLIWPYESQDALNAAAAARGWSLSRITRVRGHASAEFKRVLTEWSREEVTAVEEDELVIERSRHEYTDQYITLTREFYLHM